MPAIESADLTDALVKELCSGRRLMEERQYLREHVAAAEATLLRGHRSVASLGKCVAVIPQHEWFLLRAKYGEEAMHDKGFIRDFQKHEPAMAVNKI